MSKQEKPVPVERLSEGARHLYEVMNSQSDLACVVVGAAFLDAALKTLLSQKLLKSSNVTDRLLDDGGALGTFSARADLAYCLGTVKKHHYTDLCVVMQIRNQFAHKHFQLAFNDSTVCEKCGSLKAWKALHSEEEDTASELTPKQLAIKARNQFNITVSLLSSRLLLTALEIKQGSAT